MDHTGASHHGRENLFTPLQYLKGVGSQRAELFAKLGLNTVADVLFHFPRGYQDLSQARLISELKDGQATTVQGVIEEWELRQSASGKSVLGLLIRQDEDYLRALWFNNPHLQARFVRGNTVLLSGEPHLNGGRWEMKQPRFQAVDSAEPDLKGRILPIYPLTKGLQQHHVATAVKHALAKYMSAIDEVFPKELLDRWTLWPIHDALPQLHNPQDQESLDAARYRFVFQELLVLQLALALRKQQEEAEVVASAMPACQKIDARIRRLFPFTLGESQNQVIQEISADMASTRPMHRLLQGDVGAGKTVVAMYAMLLAAAHGQQAALMAPTEVLAQQHFAFFQKTLANARVRLAFLSGSLSTAERKKLKSELASGAIDLLIGTQAMLQDAADFAALGLVVIDEQQKFGVEQRAVLKNRTCSPHYLVMTATPIPRSLALTFFGDLDISTLRESPAQRAAVHTYVGEPSQTAKWWEFFRKKLNAGRQGFVVAPHVNEGDEEKMLSVEQLFESLTNGELADFRVDLIHGRQTSAQKHAAMDDFRTGRTQVLVATSLIEVGMDISNAALMTIFGAEHFGLAQLHQLRGRVGRGRHTGYVCVFAESDAPAALQRLQDFAHTNNGFELAELDLKLRGPGDLLGQRQHGMPPLKIADLTRDVAIAARARAAAGELTEEDPQLSLPEHAKLRRMVMARYGRVLNLGGVG